MQKGIEERFMFKKWNKTANEQIFPQNRTKFEAKKEEQKTQKSKNMKQKAQEICIVHWLRGICSFIRSMCVNTLYMYEWGPAVIVLFTIFTQYYFWFYASSCIVPEIDLRTVHSRDTEHWILNTAARNL